MSKIQDILFQVQEKQLQLKKAKYGTSNPQDILYDTIVKLGDTVSDPSGNAFPNVIGLDNKIAIVSEDGKSVKIVEKDASGDFSVTVLTRDEMRLIADMFRKIK